MIQSYDFNTKLTQGEKYEELIQNYLSPWFEIQAVSMEYQKNGVDRLFIYKQPIKVNIGDDEITARKRYSVEIKTDFTAAKTGNAFIETISVDKDSKEGWAFTSISQLLFYFIPPKKLLYAIEMPKLKRKLTDWLEAYPTRAIPNKGYSTHGVLVPLNELEDISISIWRDVA